MKTPDNEFRLRPLGKPHPYRRIGDSDEMELIKPHMRRFDIFADTETYYETGDMEPWDYVGTDEFQSRLQELVVVPFILIYHFRRMRERKKNDELYISGGGVERIEILDDTHFERLFIDMALIYNELGMIPRLYFHNASYDLSAMMPFFHYLDPELRIHYYVNKTSKSFISGYMQSVKYNFFCEFGDTLKYDKTLSIDKAGKILGKPKIKGVPYGLCDIAVHEGQIEYTSLYDGSKCCYSLDKYVHYANQDVIIMREIHERRNRANDAINALMIEDGSHNEELQKNFRRKCGTLGAHAKSILNCYLLNNGWRDADTTFRYNMYDLGDDKTEFLRATESNTGGYTSFNKHIYKYECAEDEVIHYYDQNSMYPNVMVEGVPYGYLLDEPPIGEDFVIGHAVSIRSCKWKGIGACHANQPFGVKKQNENEFYVESEYLKFVQENCDIDFDLVATKYQRKTTILAPLIHKYYTERKRIKDKMKDEKNPTLQADLDDQQQCLKVLMNSLYGKFCEKPHHVGCVYHRSQYSTYLNEKREHRCILTGSYITYRGRLSLFKKIGALMEEGYTYLYSDTDSVMFVGKKDQDPTTIFGKDRGNLGEWKLEGNFDLYLNIGKKKKYALINRKNPQESKIAFSGIPKNLLMDKLISEPEEAIEDLIFIFDPNNNVVFKGMSTKGILNNVCDQHIIYNTDFAINRGREPNGWVHKTDDGFILIREDE